MGEALSDIARKALAVVVLVVAAYILFKMVLGFVAAIAWIVVARYWSPKAWRPTMMGFVLPVSDQVCKRCGRDLDFPEELAEPAGNPV